MLKFHKKIKQAVLPAFSRFHTFFSQKYKQIQPASKLFASLIQPKYNQIQLFGGFNLSNLLQLIACYKLILLRFKMFINIMLFGGFALCHILI
jgi:hypothetical protein